MLPVDRTMRTPPTLPRLSLAWRHRSGNRLTVLSWRPKGSAGLGAQALNIMLRKHHKRAKELVGPRARGIVQTNGGQSGALDPIQPALPSEPRGAQIS